MNTYTNEIIETFLEKKLEIAEYSLGEKSEETYRQKWNITAEMQFLNPQSELNIVDNHTNLLNASLCQQSAVPHVHNMMVNKEKRK